MTNAHRAAQRHGSSSTLTRARAAACVRARARTPRRAQFHIDFGIVHSEITEIPQPMSPGYIINMCACVAVCNIYTKSRTMRDGSRRVDCYVGWRG